jgi:ATP-dependent Clp protease adaptor protein ClpS
MRRSASYVNFPFEMATKQRPGTDDGDTDVVTETKKKEQLKKPQLYKVLFHNDNYTTMEFVIAVLREVFRKSESDAVSIMLNVHRNGFGVAGVYTFEVAETKINKTHQLAEASEFPLKLTMETEEL